MQMTAHEINPLVQNEAGTGEYARSTLSALEERLWYLPRSIVTIVAPPIDLKPAFASPAGKPCQSSHRLRPSCTADQLPVPLPPPDCLPPIRCSTGAIASCT